MRYWLPVVVSAIFSNRAVFWNPLFAAITAGIVAAVIFPIRSEVKSSDTKAVASIYNDLIFPHFRYSLAKTPAEFENIICSGLHKTSYFKYVIEDGSKHSIKGFFSIQTDDNENFTLDISIVSAFDEYIGDIINFSISQIMMRTRKFNLYFLNKKYHTNSSKIESFLKENNFINVKTQIVLVKDYYKKVSESEKYTKPAIAFSEINRKPAFKSELSNSH